jgi:hypothetical protein
VNLFFFLKKKKKEKKRKKMDEKVKRALSQLLYEDIVDIPHVLKGSVKKGEETLIRGIPFNNFINAKLISSFVTNNNVSVGSGTGAIETFLFNQEKITCVEPSPRFHPDIEVFHEPEYDFTISLVKARPEVVSDCSLWLFWPNPVCIFCELKTCFDEKMHHVEYDFEAIQMLKPKMVTMLVSLENCGSGSKKLKEWVENWEASDYTLIFSCVSMGVSGFDMKIFPLIIETQFFCFVRKDVCRDFFKTLFFDSRPVFYTKEDYWEIRNSMNPEDLILTPEQRKTLREAAVGFYATPFHPPNETQPEVSASESSSIILETKKDNTDTGFFFRFD